MDAQLVTVRQAAVLLGRNIKTADQILRRRGTPVADRVGPILRFRRADIIAVAAELRGPGRPRKVTREGATGGSANATRGVRVATRERVDG